MSTLHPEMLAELANDTSLPQALLITGPAGIGKKRLALELARSIVGSESEIDPDLHVVAPNEELKTRPIDVAAIRDLVGKLTLTANGKRRAAIILEADRMNTSAANALLKALEEPPSDCHIILVADQSWRLPVTIRSRLQTMMLRRPDPNFALAYINEVAPDIADDTAMRLLALAGGAPLAAMDYRDKGIALAEEIVVIAREAAAGKFPRDKAQSFAQRCGDADFAMGTNLLLRFLHGTGLIAAGIKDHDFSPQESEAARELAAKSNPAKIAEAFRAAAELRRQAESQALPKSWMLYRMFLSLEWLAGGR